MKNRRMTQGGGLRGGRLSLVLGGVITVVSVTGCARVMVPVYLPVSDNRVVRRVNASFARTVEAVEAVLAALGRTVAVREDPVVYEHGYDDIPSNRRLFLATQPQRVWKGPVRSWERINIIVACRGERLCEVEWRKAHVTPLGVTAWVADDPGGLARRFFSMLAEKLPLR